VSVVVEGILLTTWVSVVAVLVVKEVELGV
jgi:hypothetical protein